MQRFGEGPVAVELLAQGRHALGETRQVGQRAMRQLIHHLQAGGSVRLGEKHVEPEHAGVVAIEQLVDQFCELATRPGPAFGGQRALVKIDDDDALVDRPGQGQQQAGVVAERLHFGEQRVAVPARRLPQEQQEYQGADPEPDPDFVHRAFPETILSPRTTSRADILRPPAVLPTPQKSPPPGTGVAVGQFVQP